MWTTKPKHAANYDTVDDKGKKVPTSRQIRAQRNRATNGEERRNSGNN